MPASKLPAPPGFSKLVPFDRHTHAGLACPEHGKAAFAADLNAIPLAAAELIPASRDYPVAFARDNATRQVIPVAVTGMQDGENRFVDAEGAWRDDAYMPAFVRSYPFFPVPVRRGENGHTDTLVCVDEPALQASDEPYFYADGNPGPRWERQQKLVNELAAARKQTDALCAKLDELGLLETFEAHAFPDGGEQLRLRGLLRVAEARLNELPESELRALMQRGQLARLYAHLISLDNFRRLAGTSPH